MNSYCQYDDLCVLSTATKVPPVSTDTVSFLGLRLTISDAETGLNTTFALLVIAVFAVMCISLCFCKARKSKKQNDFD